MPSSTGRPAPGPNTLVVRAAFVPDGQQPPPEFLGDFNPLRIPATLNPATGEITCINAGTNFGGDIRAEWHPDAEQDSDDGEDTAGQDSNAWGTGTSDDARANWQRDRARGGGNRSAGIGDPARQGGQNAFGLAGTGPGDASGGRPPSSATMPNQQSAGQDGGDPAMKLARAAGTRPAAAKSRDDRRDA